MELAERVSGDTSVGHALAYCQAVEALAGVAVPARARYLRVILLELERLYNHVGDFGMIANDTGFAAAHSHCFRIRERLLRLNKRLTGHRLLRGTLAPGGVRGDLPAGLDLIAEVEGALADFEEIVEISLGNTLVADRLEGTGRLTTRTARDHGALGFVARASGLDADTRRDHPFAAYGELSFRVPVFESGDVKARTLVRVEEARESAKLIRQAVEGLPAGPLARAGGRPPGVHARLRAGRGLARADHPLADDRRRRPAGAREDPGPLVPELAAPVVRLAEEHRPGLPALQQVVQPVVLRERPADAAPAHSRRKRKRPKNARWRATSQ